MFIYFRLQYLYGFSSGKFGNLWFMSAMCQCYLSVIKIHFHFNVAHILIFWIIFYLYFLLLF